MQGCAFWGSRYQIDMKFDRQLQPATETSWVVSYGGKTIPRWRTAAILKLDMSPYLEIPVVESKFKSFYDQKPNQIPPLGIRIEPDLQAVGYKKQDTAIFAPCQSTMALKTTPHQPQSTLLL